MPLPSPRYHKLQTNINPDNGNKNDVTSHEEESFGVEDEERAWSDITARDPAMVERRASRRRQIWSTVMSLRSLVDTILLFVILGLLLDREWQKPSWFEVGGDITGFAPKSKV
jgi:F0F1-type ATP synthase assembly protein I